MANVYDLSKYLSEEKAKIIVGEDTYEIDDSFNTMIELDALAARKDEMSFPVFIKEFFETTLDKDQAEALMKKNYPMKVYTAIMESINDNMSNNQDASDSTPR